MNSVIKKNKIKSAFPNYFVKENGDIDDKTEIVNEFNVFFVNVGPSLAANIPTIKDITYKSMVKENVNSIFLGRVEKEEILSIVKSCASKGSTDCVGLDMILVKNIIEYIIEPLTYICNLSFSTGVFPEKMKIAKVIPLYKHGEKHVFSNYRPVSLLPQFS